MDLSVVSKAHLSAELSKQYHELSNRGLLKAASWAADAVVGMDIDVPAVQPPAITPMQMQAKAYFDSKEFNRCWNSLQKCPKDNSAGQFLRLFSRYHAGEAIKENDMGTEIFVNKSKQEANAKIPENPYLNEILVEIESFAENGIDTMEDSYLLYLWAVVTRAQGNINSALRILQKSFLLNPFNWSCAWEMKNCFTRLTDLKDEITVMMDQFRDQPAEHRVIFAMFVAFVNDELDPAGTVDLIKTQLLPLFPNFRSLLTLLARIYCAEGHYNESGALFEQVLADEPFRLDDLDSYSNLLYVQDQKAKLAYLAQYVTAIDKYRSESCCVVANYYSLKGEHELAVQYYTRAIVLNRNYTSTWTLMGHEFIELGNPHAAIETYRMAVDLVPYDFRPLFGLGQAYEVLGMHYFAQYYFQRALALRPGDVRLWDALGNCYEELDRDHEALSAFHQAFKISERNFYYVYRVARLHERLGDDQEAMALMTICADVSEGDTDSDKLNGGNRGNVSMSGNATLMPTPQDAAEETLPEWPARARLWLAQHEMNQSNWSSALTWARKVQHGTRGMLEEARSLEAEARAQALRESSS